MYNLARVDPKLLRFKTHGTGSAICPKGAPTGETADVFWFGFVMESNLIKGRSYNLPSGQTHQLKELQLLPIQQECDRAFGLSSMLYNGKMLNLVVTEEGALIFSTKHTSVDEDGNAEKKSTCFGFSLQYVQLSNYFQQKAT